MSADISDEQIDRILSTPIPGGSQARDWFLPHEQPRGLANVRDVVRRMLAAQPEATAAREHDHNCSTNFHARATCDCSIAAPVITSPVGTQAPAGWKLVPTAPTKEMIEAAAATPGIRAIDAASSTHQLRGNPLPSDAIAEGSPLEQAWRAMLAAAPSSPRAASPEPARVALTKAQIDSAWINRPSIHGGELMPQLYDLVRAVEIHHGIGIAAEKENGHD